jgi:hypothetical protein
MKILLDVVSVRPDLPVIYLHHFDMRR